MEGTHLALVQQCATGEGADFATMLSCFLECPTLPEESSPVLHSLQDAERVVTSVERDGPPRMVECLDGTPVLFVLSSPRSGSSLLQLCLQVNSNLYAGQELHLLPYADMRERRRLCALECFEGLIKTVAELGECNADDATELVRCPLLPSLAPACLHHVLQLYHIPSPVALSGG